MIQELVSQRIRFCHFGFTESHMLDLKSQLGVTKSLRGLRLCHSVLKDMNESFNSFLFVVFLHHSRAWLSLVRLCGWVCVSVVAAALKLLSGWLLLWCCDCVPVLSTLFIFLAGVKDSAATDICFLKWIIHLIILLVLLFFILLTSGTQTWRDAERNEETGAERETLGFQI